MAGEHDVSSPSTGTIEETRLDELEGWERVELPRGSLVHRYVILSTVGSGATGVVYAAYDPELDRRIAIKLLHRVAAQGGDPQASDSLHESRRVRMLREAQALARLRHPNVVTVHDVGRHDDRLFIAMEFVEGQTLSAWREAQSRAIEDVLAVYTMAGRGLAAAHADGLIHRDFKPDNAVVDGDGVVRVLDFGLARAVEDAEIDAGEADRRRADLSRSSDDDLGRRVISSLDTDVTQDGSLIGTPAYMAPEQHLRLPATAAADQFAFCVALWEALYGERPFSGNTLADLSANVVAGRLRSPPAGVAVPTRIRKALQRGLSPEPEQRWPGMDALLEALRHDPQPRRRRLLALGGGVAALVVVVVAAVGMPRNDPFAACRAGGDRIDEVWNDARRVDVREAFLATKLVYAESAYQRLEPRIDDYAERWRGAWADACSATHREHQQSPDRLDRRLACLERQRIALDALLEVLAAPHEAKDETTVERALDAAAELEAPAVCRYPDARDGVDDLDPAVADALDRKLAKAHALDRTGDYQGAGDVAHALLEETQATSASLFTARAHALLASIAGQEDDTKTVLKHLRAGYVDAERAGADRLRAELARRLAVQLGIDAKTRAFGEAWLARAQAMHERHALGDRARADLAFAEGRILLAAGEFDDAIERLRESATLAEQIKPDDPLAGRASWGALATAYREKAMYPEAREIDERLVAASRARYGEDHPETGHAISNLGNTLHLSGNDDDAVPVFARALEVTARTFGEDSIVYANRLNNYAVALDGVGREEEALRTYERALEIGEARWGPADKRVAPFLENLGTVYTAKGDYQRAHELLQRSRDIRIDAFGPDHPVSALNDLNFGWAKFKLGRHDEALTMLRHGLSVWEEKLGADYADNGIFHNNIGDVLREQGDCEAADAAYRQAIALFEPTYGDDYTELVYPLSGLGVCQVALGRPDEARATLERALELSKAGDYPPGYLATPGITLAELLTDEAPARARSLAEAALMDAKEEPGRPQLPRIEAWFADHGRGD